MNLFKHIILILLMTFSSHALSQLSVSPNDASSRIYYLDALLEQIKQEMGIKDVVDLNVNFINVNPRDVYYQSLVLFRKSDRLAFEWTKTKEKEPNSFFNAVIKPHHILSSINQSIDRLLLVKKKLGISEPIKQVVTAKKITPTDNMAHIFKLNRKINALLSSKIKPSDVYPQVQLSTQYVKRFLLEYVESDYMTEPKFVRGKMPIDVYHSLQESYQLIKRLSLISNTSIMEINFDQLSTDDISSSDVYDLANALISELIFFNKKFYFKDFSESTHRQNIKVIPSDVYQKSLYLKHLLNELLVQKSFNEG